MPWMTNLHSHMTAALVAVVATMTGAVTGAFAQERAVSVESNESAQAPADGGRSADRWNGARAAGAKETPVPMLDPNTLKKSAEPPKGPSVTVKPQSLNGGEAKVSGDPAQVPFKWTGKLFYTQPNGDYMCSGQFITPRVVLTAAHCVRDQNTGKFYSDFDFELQYENGRASRKYDYDCVATKRGWVSGDDPYRYDFAMLLVKGNSLTGYLGYHYGYSDDAYQRGAKIGYPGDILKGKVIQVDDGPLFFPTGEPGIIGLRHGNPRNAGGSSGGAWVSPYVKGGGANTNYVISVTSHHRGSDTTVSYGPRFDDAFKTLLEYVTRGCKS